MTVSYGQSHNQRGRQSESVRFGGYSNFSSSSNLDRTTSLLVSSISPARNISSNIAYTCVVESVLGACECMRCSPCRN
jgi:hypothetical protein